MVKITDYLKYNRWSRFHIKQTFCACVWPLRNVLVYLYIILWLNHHAWRVWVKSSLVRADAPASFRNKLWSLRISDVDMLLAKYLWYFIILRFLQNHNAFTDINRQSCAPITKLIDFPKVLTVSVTKESRITTTTGLAAVLFNQAQICIKHRLMRWGSAWLILCRAVPCPISTILSFPLSSGLLWKAICAFNFFLLMWTTPFNGN